MVTTRRISGGSSLASATALREGKPCLLQSHASPALTLSHPGRKIVVGEATIEKSFEGPGDLEIPDDFDNIETL